jgi:hypothetical protein
VSFHSILGSEERSDPATDGPADDDAFQDLNLDQVVASIVGTPGDDIASLFHVPLRTSASIEFRHEVFRDLQRADVMATVRRFVASTQTIETHLDLVSSIGSRYAREGAFIEAALVYIEAVETFDSALGGLDLESRGMTALRSYVAGYAASDRFAALIADTNRVAEGLTSVRYTLVINGRRATVGRYQDQADYGEQVEETFARFTRGETRRFTNKLREWTDLGHVEERILDLVARLYPRPFHALDDYFEKHRDCLDAILVGFSRDVRFYIAVLDFIEPIERAGLHFCYPEIVDRMGDTRAVEAFDLALADRLVRTRNDVVTNDFSLAASERIVVVTGPNQGGKTTFARMFGQLHHLAALGCPVPGTEATLPLCDRVLTHFEREEHLENLRGKLADDLVRVRDVLERATGDSVLIMNETLSSTALADARFLGEKLLQRIIELDTRCVYVTFVDELASLDERIVSMVGGIDPAAESIRTYKISRRPADGRAYAMALADRYELTYEKLKGRIEC